VLIRCSSQFIGCNVCFRETSKSTIFCIFALWRTIDTHKRIMMYKDVDFKINARIRKCLLHTSCHNILLFGTQEACEGRKTKKNITEEREGTDNNSAAVPFQVREGMEGSILQKQA